MKLQYTLKNLDCANCALKIENHFKHIPGYEDTTVNFSTSTLHINSIDLEFLRNEIGKIESQVEIFPLPETQTGSHPLSLKQVVFNRQIIFISISTILLAVLLVFGDFFHGISSGYGDYVIALVAFFLCGWTVLVKAGKTIYHHQWFDENVLMSIASIGALAIHALEEAVGVMIFYQIGEVLQSMAVNRSRRSISKLLEIRPDYANLKTTEGVRKVSPMSVNTGDVIIVKAGEKIPLDSVIVDGRSQINAAVLTGESVPKRVEVFDTVLAGEINLTGILTLRVLKPFSESSVSKILDLVENAAEKKTRIENFVTTFARYYTPLVVAFSGLLAVIPPLLIPGQSFSTWIYRALVLLVISCPCALIISIPLGYFGGIGGASRRGILIKGSNFIDALANIGSVVFDKTGTLTKGNFKVHKVIVKNHRSEQDLLKYAALAEAHSNHPIAKSIVSAFTSHNGPINEALITEHQEIPGQGVIATVNGYRILAGNNILMEQESVSHEVSDEGGTVVYVAINNIFCGYIVIRDELKEDSKDAISQLYEMGINDISILTGDNYKAAQMVADQLQISKIYAELLPEHKVEVFENLSQSKNHKGTIAFIGDGINDSPVLARADVGIAMGALGSEAAIETADVVLMTDHPSKVAEAISVGRRTRTIVIQNIIMSLGIKLVFVTFGSFGLASMWEAIFADIGVAILAVLNSSRALKVE